MDSKVVSLQVQRRCYSLSVAVIQSIFFQDPVITSPHCSDSWLIKCAHFGHYQQIQMSQPSGWTRCKAGSFPNETILHVATSAQIPL